MNSIKISFFIFSLFFSFFSIKGSSVDPVARIYKRMENDSIRAAILTALQLGDMESVVDCQNRIIDNYIAIGDTLSQEYFQEIVIDQILEYEIGRYHNSIIRGEKALEIIENNPFIRSNLNKDVYSSIYENLGRSFFMIEEWTKTLEAWLEWECFIDSNLYDNMDVRIRAGADISRAYIKVDKVKEAREYLEKAYSLVRCFSYNVPIFTQIDTLGLYGFFLLTAGEYAHANKIYDEILPLLYKVKEEINFDKEKATLVGILLNDMSKLYTILNDYEKALHFNESALNLYRGTDIKDENLANILTQLASLKATQALQNNDQNPQAIIDQMDECIKLQIEACDLIANIYGDESPQFLNFLSFLGALFDSSGLFDEAKDVYMAILEKTESTANKSRSPIVALSRLIHLAEIEDKLNLDIQDKCYKLLDIINNFEPEIKKYGGYLPDYIWGFPILASYRMGDITLFNEFIISFYNNLHKKITYNISNFESVENRTSFWDSNINRIKSLYGFQDMLNSKSITPLFYNINLLYKNAKLHFAISSKTEIDEFFNITWQDVQKGLKDKDVAIEFVSFELDEDCTMYLAYVLKPDMEAPEMVKLFEEKDLTSLYPPTSPENIYHKEEASDLIWRKLEPYLEGCENVYFAPDGVLHQIAIEYLLDFEGDGTMADKFNMYRLSSTRQLAINHDKDESTSAAVYGGIVYDNDVASMETESRKYKQDNEKDFLAHRGFNPFLNYADILNTRDGVKFLEGTKAEAEEVNKSLQANNYKTKLVTGKEATEESFKNLSGKNNGIIHIATHGFYWKEDEADRKARSNERLMFMSTLNDNGPRYVEDKALTRSGLFMAGANNILSGDSIPEGVDDGILTAQEIAQMNLRGTDLIVLSACQTGMGEISGDGVFGLQRGFKKAGANSLLMSLWDVDDAATQMLMTNFYQNLMSGQSKQQSLLNAQKTVREFSGMIGDRYREFSDPKYWAGFILLDALN